MVFDREGGQKRTMLEHEEHETAEVQGREVRVQGAYKIFVEPLGFLNLEAYSWDSLKVLLGEVDYESDAEVVQP